MYESKLARWRSAACCFPGCYDALICIFTFLWQFTFIRLWKSDIQGKVLCTYGRNLVLQFYFVTHPILIRILRFEPKYMLISNMVLQICQQRQQNFNQSVELIPPCIPDWPIFLATLWYLNCLFCSSILKHETAKIYIKSKQLIFNMSVFLQLY